VEELFFFFFFFFSLFIQPKKSHQLALESDLRHSSRDPEVGTVIFVGTILLISV